MPLFILIRQFSEININFMINLSLSTLKHYIYNIILVVIYWYIKVVKYFFIIKFINIYNLVDFIYHHISLILID